MGKLTDIAKELNVSPSTVSRALRNDPRISLAMRQKTIHLADEMGYRPNPEISETMKRIRSGGSLQEAIALWWPGASRSQLEEDPRLRPVLAQVCKTAETLRMGVVHPGESNLGDSPAVAARILKARGIRGIILMPGIPAVYELPPDFSDFEKVAIGNAVQGTVPVRVTPNFENIYSQIFEQLFSRGYRRPGLIVRSQRDQHYLMRYLGAYDYFVHYRKYFRRLKHFDLANHKPGTELACSLEKWIERQKPDSIVSPHEEIYRIIAGQLNRAIPKDMAYVATSVSQSAQEIAGLNIPLPLVGKQAVWSLYSLLHDSSRKKEGESQILINADWHEGKTLPYKTNSSELA